MIARAFEKGTVRYASKVPLLSLQEDLVSMDRWERQTSKKKPLSLPAVSLNGPN